MYFPVTLATLLQHTKMFAVFVSEVPRHTNLAQRYKVAQGHRVVLCTISPFGMLVTVVIAVPCISIVVLTRDLFKASDFAKGLIDTLGELNSPDSLLLKS